MIVPFYRAFEDRHRGSRELILDRLNIYLPFIAPLKQLYGECPALDLGCGRGEWLQVLLQNGFTPMGVDLDEGMLEGCKSLNLPAIQGDALEVLKNLPDESQVVVSGFHIAEHIPFDDLKELVAQALRVLKPGGLLILETPNAENIVVGTQNFYLDPTHERPIPHLLLSFLTEYSGFSRSKLLRLQESPELASASSTALMSVLGGVSPDYAIVAQKEALPEELQSFDPVFEQDHGLPLEVLAHRYDAEAQSRNSQIESRLNELSQDLGTFAEQVQEVERQNSQLQASFHEQLESRTNELSQDLGTIAEKIQEVERQNSQLHNSIHELLETHLDADNSKASQAEDNIKALEAERNTAVSHAQDLSAQVNDLNARLNDALGSAHHWWTNAKAHESRVNAILSSTSWRITWPIRVIMRALRRIVIPAVRMIKAVVRRGAALLVRCLLAMPVLRNPISAGLKRYPRLHARLVQFARHRGLIQANMAPATSTLFHAPKKQSPQITTALIRESQDQSAQTSFDTDKYYAGKKVAVLAPVSSSGVAGGAERFYSGLIKALQDQGCDVELVCLPVDEATFGGIQQGYQDFAELDLSGFDLVISTKAPSYAVNHPNHVLYLVHTVRVFYDMFNDVFPDANDELKAQQSWIHQEDDRAFSGVKHRFSIGTEVSKRLVDWNNYDAEVIHPPIDIEGLYNAGSGDYFFMPGRLHAWKRVDLAIKAIKSSSLPMKLVISGAGDAEQHLREIANGDARIEFLGRVDDDALKRLYAGALAVPFLPIREDYGYITLEAFASGKPVITCTDSGEPQVFVENEVSGFVCAPQPQSVCEAFEKLWQDRTLASRMGNAGRERVSGINWKIVSNRLLQAGFPEIKPPVVRVKVPLKVAVLDMQPIIPAVGGGRLRLLGLYHALGAELHARYVGSYDWPGEKYRRHTISPTFEEIDVPLSAEHHAAALQSACKAGGKTVIDMLFPQQAHLSPEYLQEVFDAVKWAEVVVFSHPWVAPLVSDELLAGKTVIYDSQNVESELRSQLLDLGNPFEKNVLDEVVRSEKLVGDRADIVLACSQEDIEGFVSRFGWSRTKLKLVPNGVFSDVIQPPTLEQKAAAREALGLLKSDRVAFFIGSNYAPNIEAGLFIVGELAKDHPDYIFAIGGGVCSRLPATLPKNVRSIGFLEEEDKVRWLHASDFAINPMFSGSGTNIKMFDFMSAGLPIVTTPIGARGIAFESTGGLYIAEREGVSTLVRNIFNDRGALATGGQENRRTVEKSFSWEAISPALGGTLRSAHLRKQGAALLLSPEQAINLRVAHLSTVGLKCGIGEYTRKLISVYQSSGIANFILAGEAANEKPVLSGFKIPVDIVWFYDNVTWNSSYVGPKALERLLEWDATHLIVQYHPGYYPAEMLISFVESVRFHGIAVTVIVHNFTNETAAAMRRLNGLGVALFSHRTTEVIQAKALGVVLERVPLAMEFKEGVEPKSIASRDWVKQPPVIITTGFLRKHKGVVSLVRAMPEVLKKMPGAQLVIQCALYPSDDSESEFRACELEIARLGIAHAVRLDTRFLDKEVVLEELAKADLAVLPYEQSNEGGSATAADCMCVGLPLIVSNAEIFDEVRSVAFTVMPSVKNISEGILEVLSSAELYATLERNSVAHAKENSWMNFSGRFLSV